jgi:uncharacterized repeat protein (TIGR01451 family)
MLAPLRMMAPVGSEVILVSGLLGERNAFVTRESIEWTLTPDSVGHIVVAGEESDCLKQILHQPPNKRNATYAVTRTSSSAKVLTRGTPKPTDDVSILRGQSWVTITSPTEGATHVSVLAPKAENWDQRRKTATIHWVDVQWTLPAPAVVQASDPHTLTTIIRRSSGKPLPGWIVRYEVSKTSGISFGQEGQDGVEVTSDENGEASINLMPPNKSSSAQFLIKIIRPSRPDDDLPRMVVGQGWTSVTWSAPDPQVTVYGPESAAIGSTVTYRAEISNAGDVTSRQTVASATIPPNMTYLRSDPPARVIGNELSWDLGDLAPQDKRSISITCRPERNGSVRFSVRVDSADTIQGQRLAAEASVNTQVFTSALSLNVTGPNTANVGDTVTFEIEVSNTGFEALNNIVIRDQLPAGLVHPTDPGSVIQKLFGSLAAGDSRKIAVKLIVRQTGRLAHTVDATADGGHSASATAYLEARDPPKPDLQVTIDGPEQRRVGETAIYTIRVENTGEATLTNVRIVSTYDASLFPQQATPGYDAGALRMQRSFIWPAGRLARGETKSFGMEFECVNEAAAAWCRVSVEAAEGVRRVEDARTRISPRQRVPVRPETPPPRIPGPKPPKPHVGDTGELKLSIAGLRNPIAIDTTTEHRIVIENARNISDRNIELTIHIPRGLDYVGLSGPEADLSMSPDRRTVVARIAELRANEKLSFGLEMKGIALGKHTVKITVNSLESAQPVEAEEDTTVNKTG